MVRDHPLILLDFFQRSHGCAKRFFAGCPRFLRKNPNIHGRYTNMTLPNIHGLTRPLSPIPPQIQPIHLLQTSAQET